MKDFDNPLKGQHHGAEPHLLREIVRTNQALMGMFSREVGAPSSRFGLMRLLANAGEGGMGIMDIARQLGVNASAITRQLNDMEKFGQVLRHSNTQDSRRSYARLSAKGLREFDAIHLRSHKLEQALAAAIGQEEMLAAAKVLAKLRAFIESLPPGGIS